MLDECIDPGESDKKRAGRPTGTIVISEWSETENELFTRNVMWCFRWNVLDESKVKQHVREFAVWLRQNHKRIISKMSAQTTSPGGIWMHLTQCTFPERLHRAVAVYLDHTVDELRDPQFVKKMREMQLTHEQARNKNV